MVSLDSLRLAIDKATVRSSIRGEDSTGFSIMNPEARYTYKTLTDSSTLVDKEEWSNVINHINRETTIAMGHVRFATHGDVKVRNAHPFNVGEVTGAHNGVIYNYNIVAKQMGKDSPEVDSQVLFQSLNRKEMSRAFEDINGDFAITWVKDSNKKIHLARESGRPMVISYWKKARVLLWASTESIMSEAMTRAGLRLPISKVNADYIFTYDTDKFNKKPSVEVVRFETLSQFSTYRDSYMTGLESWRSYDKRFGSPSPASKLLSSSTVDRTKMCNFCYEDVDYQEIYTDSCGRSICIACEYSPSYGDEGVCNGEK